MLSNSQILKYFNYRVAKEFTQRKQLRNFNKFFTYILENVLQFKNEKSAKEFEFVEKLE